MSDPRPAVALSTVCPVPLAGAFGLLAVNPLASGPHTLRGIEWYHGHLIAYSPRPALPSP